MERLIKITEDGSTTLYVPDLNEHYHSIHGAIQESRHVFINAGLFSCAKKPLHILEIGFGTGLNALLTYLNRADFGSITYETLEVYPLNSEQLKLLNYLSCLNLSAGDSKVFEAMHSSPWELPIEIAPDFILYKRKKSVVNVAFGNRFDMVYFDAFAPQVQPELWAEEIFTKISKVMNPDAILVTYCAKGEVRRCLQRSGLVVERIPGPPGKREMIRAFKPRL